MTINVIKAIKICCINKLTAKISSKYQWQSHGVGGNNAVQKCYGPFFTLTWRHLDRGNILSKDVADLFSSIFGGTFGPDEPPGVKDVDRLIRKMSNPGPVM